MDWVSNGCSYSTASISRGNSFVTPLLSWRPQRSGVLATPSVTDAGFTTTTGTFGRSNQLPTRQELLQTAYGMIAEWRP